MEIETDNDELGSFFQFGTLTLSQLDGSGAFTDQAKELFLSRVFHGATAFRGQPASTLLSVVNPNVAGITAQITLTGTDSAAATVNQQIERQLPAHGFFVETIEEAFGVTDVVSGSIRIVVTEGEGAIAFERIQLLSVETVIGLNASAAEAATKSFSAQLASLGAALFTNINLINTTGEARTVTATAVAEDGSAVAAPVQIQLEAGEQGSMDARDLFRHG